jgi:3-dehydroquinate dehydratase/shikimate dehydrogenase
VCSILERTGAATRGRQAEVPEGVAFVEIRGDHLTRDELCEVVSAETHPTIATVRRPEDGGGFTGSEDERIDMLRGALDAGATLVDVELDSPAETLAAGGAADRVVLSDHGAPCRERDLEDLYRRMVASPARRLKIVPTAERVGEVDAVRRLLASAAADGREVACFAMGRSGAVSRLLAPSWGSWASYGAVAPGGETAPGQFTATDLIEVYRVDDIRPETPRFALVGSHVFSSPSPAMHAAGYRACGLDARYFPVELDEPMDIEILAAPDGPVGASGLAATMPFKEAVAARCATLDDVAGAAGAVNTVSADAAGWRGYNTDGPAVLALVRRHVEPRGARVAIVGAGGTALAAATVLAGAGAQVVLYNRSVERAREAASRLGVGHAPLDDLEDATWDVLVQATPLGRTGEEVLPEERLCGRLVVEAVYGVETPLVATARARGLQVVDGYDLLVEQAVLQFELLTGRRPDAGVLREACDLRAARGPR